MKYCDISQLEVIVNLSRLRTTPYRLERMIRANMEEWASTRTASSPVDVFDVNQNEPIPNLQRNNSPVESPVNENAQVRILSNFYFYFTHIQKSKKYISECFFSLMFVSV